MTLLPTSPRTRGGARTPRAITAAPTPPAGAPRPDPLRAYVFAVMDPDDATIVLSGLVRATAVDDAIQRVAIDPDLPRRPETAIPFTVLLQALDEEALVSSTGRAGSVARRGRWMAKTLRGQSGDWWAPGTHPCGPTRRHVGALPLTVG